MKKFNLITKLIVLFFSANIYSQNNLQGIIVEKYYQPNAADVAAAGAGTTLTTNHIVFRVYAEVAQGWKVLSVKGAAGAVSRPLVVSTTTSFYNTSTTTNNTAAIDNVSWLDSYFAMGAVGPNMLGILKADDAVGSILTASSALQNNPGTCFNGPIDGTNGIDGVTTGTDMDVTVLGLSNAEKNLTVNISQENGTWYNLSGSTSGTESTTNRVLLGQFTTDGIFSFKLNIALKNFNTIPTQTQEYVYGDAEPGEIVKTFLNYTFVPNVLPTLSFGVAVPNISGQITGTSRTFNLTSADPTSGGSITSVELFEAPVTSGGVVGTPVSLGNATPGSGSAYSKSRTFSTPGIYQISAVSTDVDCGKTTVVYSPNITVAQNTAPTATLTATTTSPYTIAGSAPTYGNVYQGATLTLSCAGNDNDGTINAVEFYSNATGTAVQIGTTIVPNPLAATTTQTQSYTIPSNYSGTLSLYARVKDDQNVWSTNNTITMNVVPNPVPVVTLTAPTSSTSIIAPNPVTLSATASDDGSVTQVDFLVDNVSVGIDNTSPYSVSWTSTAGTHTFKAVATDNMSALGYSSTVTVDVVDPNAPPYKVSDLTQYCDQNTYLMPVTVMPTYTVNNVIGYDIVLNYNAAKLTPTGDIIMNTAALGLINPSYVDAVSSIMPVNGTGNTSGTLNISLYLNSSAPVNTFFTGTDKNICFVKFNRNGLGSVESTPVAIASLNESYYNQVVSKGSANGTAASIKNTTYVGNLQFWFDNQAMPYTQGTNLITEVNGSIVTTGATATINTDQLTIPTSVSNVIAGMKVVANGVTPGTTVSSIAGNVITLSANTPVAILVSDEITFVSATAVTPNASGSFTHSLLNGQKLRISRDISSNQTVQGVINAADAVIAKTVVLGGNYTPSIYQMLAMDVNLDGKVSAGDVSQMKQRATSSYGEFRQAWNYSAAGVSNGQPSKDWVFVDQTTVSSDAAYQISSTFPAQTTQTVGGVTSNVGYSKNNVPVVNFNLNANVLNYSTCPLVETETYKGIMLGDANGSYATLAASTGLKSENAAVVLDLASAVKEGNTFRIPVSFESTESTNALDFAVRFNENNVSFAELNNVAVGMEASSFMNEADRTLRFTGFDVANFAVGATVAELVLQSNNETISEKDIIADLALVNGKPVDVKFEKSSEAIQSVFNVSIYPNPSNGAFSVQATENAIVDVYDMNGKQITASQVISSNGKVNIDLNNVEAGVYLVRVQNETFSTTKRIVIEK
jgi:hypothetical protein